MIHETERKVPSGYLVLLILFVFFAGVVFWVFRPGSSKVYAEGSRAKIVGGLTAPITLDTTAQIEK